MKLKLPGMPGSLHSSLPSPAWNTLRITNRGPIFISFAALQIPFFALIVLKLHEEFAPDVQPGGKKDEERCCEVTRPMLVL